MSADPAYATLAAIAEPRTPLLADFLHNSSPDPSVRTMAAAMFALTLWQTTGRAMTPVPPWMLLVNAGEAEPDPLDAFADCRVIGTGGREPPEDGSGQFAGSTPEFARAAMVTAVRAREGIGPGTPHNEHRTGPLETRFDDARNRGYGPGAAGNYARTHNDELGWITGPDDCIVLRLGDREDRDAFRRDVLEKPGKLFEPAGPRTRSERRSPCRDP